MKKNRLLITAILMLVALLMFSGCSDDDNPVESNNATKSFDDLNASQRDSVAVGYFARNVVLVESGAEIGIASILDGEFGGMYKNGHEIIPKGPVASVAEAPEGWSGPDGDGWYSMDVSEVEFITYYKLRWTPDVWADTYTGEPVTRLEQMHQSDLGYLSPEIEFLMDYDSWIAINDTRDLVEGGNVTSVTMSGDGAFDYEVSVSFDHVTVDPEDHAGNYQSSGNFVFVDANTGDVISMRNLDSEYSFIADGSGTGNASISGVEVIRYEFDAIVEGSIARTGRYYLLSEGWAIAHEFSIYL